jgi:predicted deacylase
MGGRSEFEEQWAQKIAFGLRSALQVAGILAPKPLAPRGEVSIPVGPTTVLRPNQGGLFVPRVRAGDVGTIVPGGTVLGYLHDPVTQATIETFEAPFDRTALLLLRPMLAQLEGGAMTYVVAEPTG